MSTSQPSTPQDPVPSKCDFCDKTEGSFKRCAKCKTVAYCNRECQKADWKSHKKDCARLAGGVPPKRTDAKPFTAIYHSNFLHDREEKETFKILVDVVRMRQEDVYVLEGDTMSGTIYDQEPTSERAFRDFLRRAKRVSGFLPPWWTDEKAEECVRFGLRDDDFSLACAREKSDIQETWKDNRMPMKLRMLGEKVYGNTPGGTRGEPMLELMMGMEGGSLQGTTSMFSMG